MSFQQDFHTRARQAERAMRQVFAETPLQRNVHLSERFGCDIWLKREDLTPVRSYKLRGAFNAMRKVLDQSPDARLFVCASAGNHAQGVAYMCQHFGVRALDGFGSFDRAELAAAGALIDYVELTQRGKLTAIKPPAQVSPRAVMAIDAATRTNLELTRTLSGAKKGSLLSVIDRTVTYVLIAIPCDGYPGNRPSIGGSRRAESVPFAAPTYMPSDFLVSSRPFNHFQ